MGRGWTWADDGRRRGHDGTDVRERAARLRRSNKKKKSPRVELLLRPFLSLLLFFYSSSPGHLPPDSPCVAFSFLLVPMDGGERCGVVDMLRSVCRAAIPGWLLAQRPLRRASPAEGGRQGIRASGHPSGTWAPALLDISAWARRSRVFFQAVRCKRGPWAPDRSTESGCQMPDARCQTDRACVSAGPGDKHLSVSVSRLASLSLLCASSSERKRERATSALDATARRA
ncbi:hypothetical protein VTN02DRAFT_1230 [Thermoascus thermophilus]